MEVDSITASLAAGAKGYLSKHSDPDELIQAIQSVQACKIFLSAQITENIVSDYLTKARDGKTDDARSAEMLSEREREIISLIADGLSYKEIGNKLFISARTVESHKNNIMTKMNFQSLAELIKFAIRNKLTSF